MADGKRQVTLRVDQDGLVGEWFKNQANVSTSVNSAIYYVAQLFGTKEFSEAQSQRIIELEKEVATLQAKLSQDSNVVEAPQTPPIVPDEVLIPRPDNFSAKEEKPSEDLSEPSEAGADSSTPDMNFFNPSK